VDIRLFIDRGQYALEIRHNNERIIRYTKIPDSYKGGEYAVIEQSEDKLVYKISPLYERLNTENGYILNYNIKMTNWLNFFIFKAIKSLINKQEFEIKKEPRDFSKELKETTEIKFE
jgi:hypothetical protein